ncbi:MAG: polysaccharide deacetylase family protein [Treponema sp.]|nr:polysaccharide deacetylase family protein [Treponema sp.]MCI7566236.1 polysaccharide deacetylase family protein [Treponema sp.]
MAKYISLTFDDGPNLGDDHTMNDMLDLLEKNDVVGSFFLIGNKINDENAKVIKRAFDMGCDIENHSWTHPAMPELTKEEMIEEYEKCDQAIIKITGKKPEFFRPPYIAVNDLMHQVIPTPFIQGHGCKDWEPDVSAEERIKMMEEGTKDGVLYLLHVMEGNINTLKALEYLIPKLKKDGYTFVTVPEMFRIKGISFQGHTGKLFTYC